MYACMYVTTQSKDLFNLGRYLQSIFDKPSYVEQIYLLSTIHLQLSVGNLVTHSHQIRIVFGPAKPICT